MKRLFLLAFIWGWSFLFIKVAVDGMTPPTVAALRVALGATVLLAILRARRQGVPRDRTTIRHFIIAALFGNVLPFTMLAWGEERITTALTAVLNASTPLFTAIAAAIYLGDRLRRIQLAGLAVGMLGVAVAAGLGGHDLADSSIAGSMASVLAGACYGIAFAYMRRNLIGIPPMVAAGGQLLTATVLLAPFAVASSVAGGIDLNARRVLAIVLLGAVGTGLAYVLNYKVLAEIGATRASLVTYIIPVVALGVGILVLDEPFEWRMVTGGALIVAGIAAVNQQRLRRPLPLPVGPVGTAVVVALALALTLGSCQGGDDGDDGEGAESSCGAPVEEPLDPSSAQHVLPGAPEPEYQTDPPTSGPHQPVGDIAGVVDSPLTRPVQVGILEGGGVLIQHRDGLAPETAGRLADVDPAVVVAPNPELAEPVVATAWLTRMECRAADTEALYDDLSRFVTDHAGHGPGSDG